MENHAAASCFEKMKMSIRLPQPKLIGRKTAVIRKSVLRLKNVLKDGEIGISPTENSESISAYRFYSYTCRLKVFLN